MKQITGKAGTKRIMALLLAAVMVAVLVPVLSTRASANTYASLKNIESIKKSKREFTIYEIVPQAGAGDIGYYVNGYEPTANWLAEAGRLTSTANRKTYADGIFQKLQDRQLMGGAGAAGYPLTYKGEYSEYLPWQTIPTGTAVTALELKNSDNTARRETASATGTMTKSDKGAFAISSTPNIQAGGGYVQNILYFTTDDPAVGDTGTYYYYAPTFEAVGVIDENNPEQYIGIAVYTKIDETTYKYAGTLGVDGFTATSGVDYYKVTATNAPSASKDATKKYRAISPSSAPFKEATGVTYFALSATKFSYVGEGLGDYSFSASGTGSYELTYGTVYVSQNSGYTNNNWFLKNVFDMTDADIAASGSTVVKVYTMLPTVENLNTLLTKADMIVISAGYDLNTGSSLASSYAAANDITDAAAAAVTAAAAAKTPVLIDSAVESAAGTKIAALSAALRASKDAPLVSGSFYSFKADADRTALATKNFGTNFSASTYDKSGAAYYDVYSDITYENFLRKNADSNVADNALVPVSVSVATCIRYIINYAHQYTQNHRTSIHILDVEPQTQLSSGSGCLTKAKIAADGWLPSGITPTITTMSTAEFISKIEDINEEYDLVYIGASLDNFNTSGTPAATLYNDTKMNGLIYSNIGDTYQSNVKLSGLLDTDYDVLGSETYRFSGNDLTQTKADELDAFASSGFPIVIADELVNGQEAVANRSLSVSASINTAGIKKQWVDGHYEYDYWDNDWYWVDEHYDYYVPLSASASVDKGELPDGLTYQWYYQQDEYSTEDVINLTDDGYYKTSSLPTGTFRCSASFTQNGTTYTATSQKLKLSQSYIDIVGTSDGNGKLTLTATAPASLGNVSYEWYKDSGHKHNSNNHSYEAYYRVSQISSLSADYNNYYFCKVTSGGKSYYSSRAKVSSYLYMSDFNNDTILLYSSIGNYNYYKQGKLVTATTYSGWAATQTAAGTPAAIPGKSAVPYTVRADRIDDCSIMYAELSKIIGRDNVMFVSRAKNNGETLAQYINLSKPSISLSEKPTEYAGASAASLVTGHMLKYVFTITNNTDPTPLTTRYNCSLYIDLNADGRYKSNEEITDLQIKDAAGNSADPASLSAGVQYTLTRTLPVSYNGIIPWRLKVTENASDYIHTSQEGYTYIKPDKPTVINILQITGYNGNKRDTSATGVNNPDGTAKNDLRFSLDLDKTYKQLLTSTDITSIYTIKLNEITLTDFDNEAKVYSKAYNKTMPDNLSAADIRQAYVDYLGKYNMLILGFGDGYGFGEGTVSDGGFDLVAAQAIVDYIGTKQAVLFTHDATSYVNLPYSYNVNGSYGNQWYWAYYFNDVIRNYVGLDRYGVTSPQFGITSGFSERKYLLDSAGVTSADSSGPVAKGTDGSVAAAKASALKDANYTAAYVPDAIATTSKVSAAQTQGYSALTLLRFSADRDNQYTSAKGLKANPAGKGDENTFTTAAVSQVNQGQITTFPYNINTKQFDSTSSNTTLKVSTTHEQYYQLNMNGDDVVVWYCLTGGKYSNYLKNDGVNAYYIYNKGNVTYSGAGHSAKYDATYDIDSSSAPVTLDEAKLFVNTMIAAYRAAAVNPTISFKDEAGNEGDKTSQFLPVEFSGTSDKSGTAVGSTKVYFKITDPNFDADKTVSLSFCYKIGADALTDAEKSALESAGTVPDGYTQITAPVHSAATGGVVTNYSSDTLFYIELPSDVASAIARDSSNATANLLGIVKTTIRSKSYFGENVIVLQKLGYMSLR